MKPILLLATFLVLQPCAFTQTVEIETVLINKAISEGRWSTEELPEIGSRWRQLKSQYPEMQYDTLEGQVIVEGIINFPGINKQNAFRRIKEWAAINFSDVESAVHYEDLESGKMIFKGYVEVTSYTKIQFLWNEELVPTTSNLYFTLILTVKDEKAKVRFEYLRFQNYRAGYMLGSYYVPGEWEETSLKSFFPIVYKKSSTWEGAFKMLTNCKASLMRLLPSMERYVGGINADYRF